MALILTRKQLCEALGVSDSAIGAWEKKGLPVLRKGRGRGMRSLYDLDAVHIWCDRTGSGLGVQAVLARARRVESPPLPAPAPAQTFALTADQEHCIRACWGHAYAFLRMPALALCAGVTEAQIDALVHGMLEAYSDELIARHVPVAVVADMVEAERATVAEERAAPGTWTT